MTKKDYIKLAQALKDSKPFLQATDDYKTVYSKHSTWTNTVETIAMTLQHDNKSFDKARFLNACGYNS